MCYFVSVVQMVPYDMAQLSHTSSCCPPILTVIVSFAPALWFVVTAPTDSLSTSTLSIYGVIQISLLN